jgi:universal stress protein A
MQLRHLLVPVDFSERSAAALAYATELAARLGATIDVIHVWEPPAYVAPDMMISLAEEANQRTLVELARSEVSTELRKLLRTYEQRKDLQLRGRLEIGPVAETIVKTATEGAYDAIVMSTHGRTGLSRLVLGSVSEKVVRMAPCPVLTVPTLHQAT